MSESKVKIQHRDRVGMQEATYILTPETKNPWLLFEGDADYLAIKQLQATIAEMGNVIGNDQAQIKFYRDAVADKDAEIAELREEAEISAATIEMQSVILTDSVNAIRGEPPELTLWSHHDLAELVKNLLSTIPDRPKL